MSVDTEKKKLIERINEIAGHYDSAVHDVCIDAVRNPEDKQKMQGARKFLSLSDDRRLMAAGVIQAVHRYWPGESK